MPSDASRVNLVAGTRSYIWRLTPASFSLGRASSRLSLGPNQICIIASGKVGQNSNDGEELLPIGSRVVVGASALAAVEAISEAFLLRARVCTRRPVLLVFIAGARRLEIRFFVDFFEPAVLPFLIGV
jgi:hypothetical protein